MWQYLLYSMVITTVHTGSLSYYVKGNLPDGLEWNSLNSMGKIAKRGQENKFYYAAWQLLLYYYREFPSKILSV